MMSASATIRNRLLEGEALNATEVQQQYGVDSATLSKVVRKLAKEGHDIERQTRPDGRHVWSLANGNAPSEPPASSSAPAATATPSAVIRERLLAGETLCATEVGRELNVHAATLSSVRRGMERQGYGFVDERQTPQGKKYVRLVSKPGESPASEAATAPATQDEAPVNRTQQLQERLLAGEALSRADALALGVHPATLVQVVKRLEDQGYLFVRDKVPGLKKGPPMTSYRLASGNEARVVARSKKTTELIFPALGSTLNVTMLSLENGVVTMCLRDPAGRGWMVSVQGASA